VSRGSHLPRTGQPCSTDRRNLLANPAPVQTELSTSATSYVTTQPITFTAIKTAAMIANNSTQLLFAIFFRLDYHRLSYIIGIKHEKFI